MTAESISFMRTDALCNTKGVSNQMAQKIQNAGMNIYILYVFLSNIDDRQYFIIHTHKCITS